MYNTQEVLTVLQEECAEVIQAVSKIQRFGIYSENPYTNTSNREQFEKEVGDLLCMIEIATEMNLLNKDNVKLATEQKYEKLKKWMVKHEQ